MNTSRSLKILAATALGLVVCAAASGCGPSSKTISSFFASHYDELARSAASAEAATKSLIDEGLLDSGITASRNTELAAARSNKAASDALEAVCNIAVDFVAPPAPRDEDGWLSVRSLQNAVEGEFNELASWANRLDQTYSALAESGQAQSDAQLKLKRDIEVTAFQEAFCD